jgi:hypothetical protein
MQRRPSYLFLKVSVARMWQWGCFPKPLLSTKEKIPVDKESSPNSAVKIWHGQLIAVHKFNPQVQYPSEL